MYEFYPILVFCIIAFVFLLIPTIVFIVLLVLINKAARRRNDKAASSDNDFADLNRNRKTQDNWDSMENNKKLLRSNDRVIAGVCGGFAEYIGIDPTVVRLGYVFLTLFTAFSGIIVYIIACLLMPERR